MKITRLPKLVAKSKKRLGRGVGSGKGSHTSSRGQKGQKSRGKVGVMFEGMKMKKSLIKRLPFQRGKGKFHAKARPEIIKTSKLNAFPDGTVINVKFLIEKGLVNPKLAEANGVKVLKDVELTKKLVFEIPTSKSVVAEKVAKASK